MADDLVSWLLEQIAEDERLAHDDHEPNLIDYDSHGYHPDGYEPEIIYSSARVLAECAAKRAIITLHDGNHECSETDDECTWIDGRPCETLLLLARPYADRPGYRAERRP